MKFRVFGILTIAVLWVNMPARLFGGEKTGLPEGYWDEERVKPILDKTLVVRLDPDLSGLGEEERLVVAKLLEVGRIFQDLYELARHHQALEAKKALLALDRRLGSPRATRQLLDLYRLFHGPIAITLDNEERPFLPVDPPEKGKNVYPWGVSRAKLDRFLAASPERAASILHPRSVVREVKKMNLATDLAVLDQFPALDLLHPGLRKDLESLRAAPSAGDYYAVPYSVAYSGQLHKAYHLIFEAAAAVRTRDPDFAAYLRNRARDLLTDDYESGDASWVTGRFRNLNVQMGSYETYDDSLFGVKTFFALSLLVRDGPRSQRLARAIGGIQALEDSLPYASHKKVRDDIPVGVYRIIADFGQARGTNTATILPNESQLTRKYGRTILLRYNILSHPELYKIVQAAFEAAVVADHRRDLSLEGNFHRTLWHEIGHYLGPDTDRRGRSLSVALGPWSSLVEELKSDLISLFAIRSLQKTGYYREENPRAVYASGIRRTLQKVRPRSTQPYQTMQLMQMNFFLEKGLLQVEGEQARLRIHYEKYHDTVTAMLERVLALQAEGDADAVAVFVEKYTGWDESVHGRLALRLRESETYRFRLVRYAALGE